MLFLGVGDLTGFHSKEAENAVELAEVWIRESESEEALWCVAF